MVVLNKIYTRSGDDGTTALGTGDRVPKHALRIEAYGTVDESNACVGLARIATAAPNASPVENRLDLMLARIQNDLFDLGADLCRPQAATPPGQAKPPSPLRISKTQVDRLEAEIDQMNESLEPLKSFVLPGGTALAAHLHLARTISRRAERGMTALAAEEPVNAHALKYINRLSDFFFVASRYANKESNGDVLWRPGENL